MKKELLLISSLALSIFICGCSGDTESVSSSESDIAQQETKSEEKKEEVVPEKPSGDKEEGKIEEPKPVVEDVVLVDDPSVPSFVKGQNPEEGKKWVRIEDLSDEFNDASLDEVKWLNTEPKRWNGREPGLFTKETVSEKEGNLNLTVDLLDAPQGKYTHQGSNLTSKAYANIGIYTESKIKANKTFMSTTFWLINRGGQGCNKRTTELDINETVGEITGKIDKETGKFVKGTKKADEFMNSNTHSRNMACPEQYPKGSVKAGAALGGKSWAKYHVYGMYWKSAQEIELYLDGKKVNTIEPIAVFDLPMQLRLVTETYDWNIPPADGGMNKSYEDRTSYYDWVRTWKLE